jgi:uncharacterized membrane protein YbaN (DUF454 family)
MSLFSCLPVSYQSAQFLTKWGIGLFLSVSVSCGEVVQASGNDLQPDMLTSNGKCCRQTVSFLHACTPARLTPARCVELVPVHVRVFHVKMAVVTKCVSLHHATSLTTQGRATTMTEHILQKTLALNPSTPLFNHANFLTMLFHVLQKTVGVLSGAASLPHRSKYMVVCLLVFSFSFWFWLVSSSCSVKFWCCRRSFCVGQSCELVALPNEVWYGVCLHCSSC